jgi:hypothetical protein
VVGTSGQTKPRPSTGGTRTPGLRATTADEPHAATNAATAAAFLAVGKGGRRLKRPQGEEVPKEKGIASQAMFMPSPRLALSSCNRSEPARPAHGPAGWLPGAVAGAVWACIALRPAATRAKLANAQAYP